MKTERISKEIINDNVVALDELWTSAKIGNWHGYHISINGRKIDRYYSRKHAVDVHHQIVSALNRNP